MLQFVYPDIEPNKNEPRRIIHWKLTLLVPEIRPLVILATSLKMIAETLGIKEITLRKILSDENYNSKKYKETMKFISIEPVYNK